MCKICTAFYGGSPFPEHTSQGTWFHKRVVFKKNPGKKLSWHGKSKSLKRAILAKANLASEESKASKNPNPAIHLVIHLMIIF